MSETKPTYAIQPVGQSLAETMELGTLLAKSGFFADTKEAAQAVVKVLAGRELGFGPMASMTGIYIVKGKVSLSANLIAAAIKRSGHYNYKVRKLDNDGCSLEFFEFNESLGMSSFSSLDATKAGLTDGNWKTFPRNMCFARAMSNGAKWYCADIFGGPLYTPDELGATVDGETGEVIDVTPTVVQPAPAKAPPPPAPEPPTPPVAMSPANGLPTRPYAPDVLRDKLLRAAAKSDASGPAAPQLIEAGQQALRTLCPNDDERHVVLGYLFGHTSGKQLTTGQAIAVRDWIHLAKVDGEWLPSAHAINEVRALLMIAKATVPA